MKKTIALLICTGWALLPGLTVNGQQVQEASKSEAGRVVREIPKKPAPQNAIKEDQNTKPATDQLKASNIKPASTEISNDPGDNKIKPVVVPGKNSFTKSQASTVATEIPNTVLPKLVLTDMSPKITSTPPEKKKAAVVAEQQKQN